MRAVAEERVNELGLSNVTFHHGSGENIPLQDGSVDVFTATTVGLQSFSEVVRVLRRPGLVVLLDIAPGHYGGDLNSILNHAAPGLERFSDRLVNDLGFSYEDRETVQEYGSTKNIIETYGFIFGRNAIEHLRETGKTFIRWTVRMHHRELRD
jgi:ubiquinone/menaquinone biosynthesis C-methylase UbiE